MADRLYTSNDADEVLSALRFETKLEKATLARVAFALSLAKEGLIVAQSTSFSGGEMKRPTFVGEDEFFSNRSIVKNHIDSGAALLEQLFQECGRDADHLLRRLVDEVEFSGRREVLGERKFNEKWPHLADRQLEKAPPPTSMEKSPKPSKQTATSPDLVKLFEEAYAKKNPHLPPLDRGKALKRIRDILRMLDYVRQWTKATPGNELAWYGLGLAYGELARYPEAIEAYRTALRLKPDDAIAWFNLTLAYGRSFNSSAALKALKELRRYDPKEAERLYNQLIRP